MIYNLEGRVEFPSPLNVLGLSLEDLVTIENKKIEINPEVCLDRYGMNRYIRLTYYNYQPKGDSLQERTYNALKLAHRTGTDMLRYDDDKKLLILGTSSNNIHCRLRLMQKKTAIERAAGILNSIYRSISEAPL